MEQIEQLKEKVSCLYMNVILHLILYSPPSLPPPPTHPHQKEKKLGTFFKLMQLTHNLNLKSKLVITIHEINLL